MDVGAAVADVDDVVGADLGAGLELIEDEDFAVSGVGASDGVDFAGTGVKKLGAENVVGRDDAFEGGADDFDRSGGEDVEIEMEAGDAVVENLVEQVDVFFQADAFADFV